MFFFRGLPLFLLFGITLGSFAPHYDLADAEQHFTDFIDKYEKKYETPEEYSRRYDIFKKNLIKLNEWNSQYKHKNGGYVINQFSDQEGHRSCVDLSKMSNTTRVHKVKKEYILNAPDKLDYRDNNLVTEIKNQLHCGSCYIFSAIGNIEGMHSKQSGQLISLSEQQVLDCTNHDCQGGWPANVMNNVSRSPVVFQLLGEVIDSAFTDMANQGCMAEEDYPYTAVKGTCSADQSKIKVRVTEGHTIDTPDVETMKGALVENGAPLAVLFYASKEIESYAGSDVVNPSDCNGDSVNHAIVLVGYNADPNSGKRPHWIIKNSWGTDHGDSGYFYLDFENRCSFGAMGTATSTVS